MKYAVVMAAIPAAAISWASAPRAPQIVAMAIPAEGIREQRVDDGTFRARWRGVADMPPTRETVYEPLLLVSMEGDASRARAPRPMLTRPVHYSRDVCARHHMRRINVRRGRWTGWRCRR